MSGNLMPPSFVDIEPIVARPEDAADFLKEAVAKGRIIAGTAQRLDPIKMDPIVFDGFEYLIKELSRSAPGLDILKNFRISFITETGSFAPDQRIKVLFDRYTDHAYQRIDEINALFRQVMQGNDGPIGEDFLLTHRDAQGQLTGYIHERLVEEVYPYYNIAFQLGQEGLCQSVIEPLLVGSFGLTIPRPPALVISRGLGFSEKAEDFQLPNVHIVENPSDGGEFTQAFVAAYNMAVGTRDNPGSPFIEDIRRATAAYGDIAGDSFYAAALETLYEAKQRRVT